MRTILMSLILGISAAAVASPALAGEDEIDHGNLDRFLASPDRDIPQINLGVVAGEDEPAPVVQERYEKN